MKVKCTQIYVILALFLFGFSTKTNAQNSLYDIIAASPDHTIFKSIIDSKEFDPMFKNNPGPFTLLAPTNDAFEELMFQLDLDSTELLNHPDLVTIITYHIVNGNVDFDNSSDGELMETFGGFNTLKITNNFHIYINQSELISDKVTASNGTLYSMDDVLLPFRTVVDELLAANHLLFYRLIIGSEDFLAYLSNPHMQVSLFSTADAKINKLLDFIDEDFEEIVKDADACFDLVGFHILEDNLPMTEFKNGDIYDAYNQDNTWKVTVDGPKIYMNHAEVVDKTPMITQNGYFYELDELLIPDENMIDALMDEGLITFLIMLVEKRWMPEFCSPYKVKTVLGPDNNAIFKLSEKLKVNNIPEFLQLPNIDEILKYHWSSGEELYRNDFINDAEFTAENGKQWLVKLENDTIKVNGATILTPNGIQSNNGILYVMENAIEEAEDETIQTPKVYAVGVKAYPNPTSEVIFLEGLSIGAYEIFDIQGKLVQKGNYQSSGIAVLNLHNGAYFIRVDTEGKSFAGTFLKH